MVGLVGKPGVRLRRALSHVEIVVVRPTAVDVPPTSGAVAMIGAADPAAPARADAPVESEPVLLGKRYFDEQTGLEVLCRQRRIRTTRDRRAHTADAWGPSPAVLGLRRSLWT
ncbi:MULTISPECIES: hypothetical protein [Nocardia]|uniref:hypothetical protein n=1 Tax=Nocardia TaxID=1817 RepID=UPI000D68B6AC|nr:MULTISPECIES: hypothetical protein [Nocardia]